MTHAVLSLPAIRDLNTEDYTYGHEKSLADNAVAYAQHRGKNRIEDYQLWRPLKPTELKQALGDIQRRTVVLVDAHGYGVEDDPRASTVEVPATDRNVSKRDEVDPWHLGLRETSVKLVIAGVCCQRPEAWQNAVPPGCVVIGYKKKLYEKHYRPLFERFIDLHQLLKDDRAPAAHEMNTWLEHIAEWFRNIPLQTDDLPNSSDWFITVGKA